ncbi:MAG: HelD family protein [Streptosporangiaceae bacterium]
MSNDATVREQEYISRLYGRLDDLRERAASRLAGVLRQVGGTPQARTERDAFSATYRHRLAQLDAAGHGLCFGRLEFNDSELRYIGRIGIHSDTDDYEQLLMDWRADAARPFYLATAASPGDVRVRRHIRTRDRTLISIDDEVLDLATADPSRHEGLTGESALLAALNTSRTGTMADIVETIQAEQDHIIRSGLDGIMVVQGGPGTGKTAVALHRAAYLLYTYRRQLEKRGVLVIGPNATFLRYIGKVQPSLGETSVLLSTMSDLYPGISAADSEPPETAAIKGRLSMTQVVAAAIRDRQHAPRQAIRITVDSQPVVLSAQAAIQARDRARRTRRPHNVARAVFAREIVNVLTAQVAARLGHDVLGGRNLLGAQEINDLRRDLWAEKPVRDLIEGLWPVLTPQKLISGLLSSAGRLAAAAPGHSTAEREALLRAPDAGWTPADVPLLDEAAELLGEDERALAAERDRQRRLREAYAQGVLDIIGRDDDDDPEVLMGADVLDASSLAARYEDEESLTPAERAAADRTWAFGHVIVDEAQELSEMAWRMLMRRCPMKSMTIVGDVAQTGDLAGLSSWEQALGRYAGDRWRLAGLTVNYRTPAEIMDVAADVLAGIDPALEAPRSVRATGFVPWRLETSEDGLAAAVASAAAELVDLDAGGKLAVIVPPARLEDMACAVTAVLSRTAVGDDPDLTSPVVVLTVPQAKGLEFDSVLIVDPARLLDGSPRGMNDLYVALTRATQRLAVVHPGAIPKVLARLAPRQDSQDRQAP